MFRRLLLAAAVTVLMPPAIVLAPGAAHAATTATCTDGVAVTQFAFNPPSVPLGSASALTLDLQNCTSQAIQGSTVWFGTYDGQSCPALDGIEFPYTIAPGGTYTLTNTFGDSGLEGCQPASLRMSANVNVTGVVGTVTTVSATLLFTAACSSGIAIDQLSFSPQTVAPGQASTLTLVLRNCTSQTVRGSGVWGFKITGTSPRCALDPLGFGYSIAPGGTSTTTLNVVAPVASCQAAGIAATANVSENGVTGTVATATASLSITQPAAFCHVSYTPDNWQGGFTANVTITDSGPAAINDWTLAFTFPGDETITSAWNATVTQSGANVTAANLSYNATIAPGGSASFGFQGTWTNSDAAPASFSVNGTSCA